MRQRFAKRRAVLFSTPLIVTMMVVGCGRTDTGAPDRSSADPTSVAAEAESEAEKDDAVTRLRAAIDRQDWPAAEKLGMLALVARPNDPDVMTQVATAKAMTGDKRLAATMLADAARSAQFDPPSRVTFATQALIEVGEVYRAIELLDASLARHPNRTDERKMIVAFLNEVQRTDQIPPHLRELIRTRQFDLPLLMSTTETSSRRLSERTSASLLKRNPDDRRVRLPDAFLHLYRRNAAEAIEVLNQITTHHPDFAPAHAMAGAALAAAGRFDELDEWFGKAPPASSEFAGYWLAIGEMAQREGRIDEATRAYFEATRRDPNDMVAWDRLQKSANRLDSLDPDALAAIESHTKSLLELRERFNDFASRGKTDQTAATRVAEILESLGRVWEAEAWSAIATTLSDNPSDNLGPLRSRLVTALKKDASWFHSNAPGIALDLSSLPMPKWPSGSTIRQADPRAMTLVPDKTDHGHLRLVHQSQAWGLASVGGDNEAGDPKVALLIRSTGVGGGAIDYDLDGNIDLVVAGAGGAMLETDSQPDVLLRNDGQRFVSVTQAAGVGDRGFGQGVAVGDFDADGFPDWLIANLGCNRLYRNNGDGTFTDATELLGDQGTGSWSTSAAFADLDGDGLSDLVVTNYCQPVDSLDKPCVFEQGRLGPCHPLLFPADSDQFYLTTSEGSLSSGNEQVDAPEPGRGLGVVAGSIINDRFAVLVANDMSRNHLYLRGDQDSFTMPEAAVTRGLAVDGRSQAQASMGIAASDFDRDGDLDFYVTGFAREYNVFYEQASPGLWIDSTQTLGLVEPTLMMVGFGTQAVDLDNDGIDEIMVTNGHIGDFDDPSHPPYAMPIQGFRRGQRGTFDLVQDDSWDEYFRTSHVGRSLWTMDVNRDGRNDVVVTHSDESIALLVNETQASGNAVGFRLVGTQDNRDAVGAIVRFRIGDAERSLWMLAGDGYLCSNEKTLLAGVGSAKSIQDVRVTWPDGSTESLGDIDAGQVWLIVQGQSQAFSLSKFGDGQSNRKATSSPSPSPSPSASSSPSTIK